LPLIYNNSSIGVVQFESDAVFSKGTITLLKIILDQIASSILRARDFKEVQLIANKLSMVIEVGKKIGANINLEEILEIIAKTVVEETEAYACSIRILDEEKNLVLKAKYGEGANEIPDTPIPKGEGIAAVVLEKNTYVNIPKLKEDERYYFKEILGNAHIKSLLSVPISIKDKPIGVLNVYDDIVRTFTEEEIKLVQALASEAAISIENVRLFTNLKKMYINTIKAISSALSMKDLYSGAHSEEASKIARVIAEELNLSEHEKELVEFGAILHDIGKIGVPEQILLKPDKLTEKEYEIIKQHSIIGAKILEPLEEFRELAYIIAHHHEHYNGSGYPNGLSKDDIPLAAKIIHLVDAYHAMISDRPYRKALTKEQAIEEIKKCSGTYFDPEIVEAFLRACNKQLI
jgi:putative nucleotidyltransferase with HDIG domain